MYNAWKKDPASVHVSWQSFFSSMEAGAPPGAAFTPPPSIRAGQSLAAAAVSSEPAHRPHELARGEGEERDILKVMQLVHAYESRGHNICDLDPLGIYEADLANDTPIDLEISNYGFTEADMEKEIQLTGIATKGFFAEDRARMKLKDIIARLRQVYASTIGFEFMHIWDHEQVNWIRDKIETVDAAKFTREERLRILDRLAWSDHFEAFLASKYSTVKRFGLEGCEVLIPGMEEIIDSSASLGVENIILGMAHRGRLNVLANVVKKPMEHIFCEFSGVSTPSPDDDFSGSGDVKYHLGMSHTRSTASGKQVNISLVANPSHLEAVNPVVEGKCRAKQHYTGDAERAHSMPILIHGDAAFSGQGVVFETMGLADLHNYTTGGTIHIVINNQIGFTTDPRSSRSSPYCTDVAKCIQAPIFHVNGDDVDAVVQVCRLAAQWRHRFKRDVVIDIVCYRKHGHNEIDNPMFTQPQMYTAVKKQRSTLNKYFHKLEQEGVITNEAARELSEGVKMELQRHLDNSRNYVPKKSDWLSSNWKGMLPMNIQARDLLTGVDIETLKKVGQAITTLPADLTPHKKVRELYANRKKMFDENLPIDWAVAEQLAWGSLLLEGNHVRISGQDVERGTFSHRHAVIHDQANWPRTYLPLQNVDPGQAAFMACNSSLSEFAVLGFELGYALENPASLIMWEAQFGDFANTAQCMIDQFISSGEQKWLRQSGLVMLLPHGFEGQGPEHSSARLERFLQMSDDDEDVFPARIGRQQQAQAANWQVVNVTTPANYFHVLRRQVVREFRKPLIVMSPKSLLRHRLVKSDLSEMGHNTRFMRYLADSGEGLVEPEKIRKLVLCSGKVYYDLLAERTKQMITDVAIGRCEQISPFPHDHIQADAKKYPNAEIVWCQEEPKNAGAWSYVKPRITTAAREVREVHATYAGRKPSAAASTGHASQHAKEQQQLIEAALK